MAATTPSDESFFESVKPDLVPTITGFQRPVAFRLEGLPVHPLELPVSVAGIVDWVTKVALVTNRAERAEKTIA